MELWCCGIEVDYDNELAHKNALSPPLQSTSVREFITQMVCPQQLELCFLEQGKWKSLIWYANEKNSEFHSFCLAFLEALNIDLIVPAINEKC